MGEHRRPAGPIGRPPGVERTLRTGRRSDGVGHGPEVPLTSTVVVLDLRLAGPGLRRIRGTAPQVGLSRQQRAGNLSGAFVADPSVVAGRHVVLIDDVVTTGSTVAAAAQALLDAGASGVVVWALARATQR